MEFIPSLGRIEVPVNTTAPLLLQDNTCCILAGAAFILDEILCCRLLHGLVNWICHMALSLCSFVPGMEEGRQLLPHKHLLYRFFLRELLCEFYQWILKI